MGGMLVFDVSGILRFRYLSLDQGFIYIGKIDIPLKGCLLYTSPSPRDA